MKPILLLDMDGPLADFDRAAWEWGHSSGLMFDIESLADQRHRFLTDHVVGCGHPGTTRPCPHGAGHMRRHIHQDETWFRDLPVTPGAIQGVAQLEAIFDVWVCTKPLEANPGCRDGKQAWIDKHFPSLSRKLVMAPDKSMVVGAVLLDDAPKPQWVDVAHWEPVVFSTPWNGEGSRWEVYPHWTWGDPLAVLTDRVRDPWSRARWELPA